MSSSSSDVEIPEDSVKLIRRSSRTCIELYSIVLASTLYDVELRQFFGHPKESSNQSPR
jgi:hypothetical protein